MILRDLAIPLLGISTHGVWDIMVFLPGNGVTVAVVAIDGGDILDGDKEGLEGVGLDRAQPGLVKVVLTAGDCGRWRLKLVSVGIRISHALPLIGSLTRAQTRVI